MMPQHEQRELIEKLRGRHNELMMREAAASARLSQVKDGAEEETDDEQQETA